MIGTLLNSVPTPVAPTHVVRRVADKTKTAFVAYFQLPGDPAGELREKEIMVRQDELPMAALQRTLGQDTEIISAVFAVASSKPALYDFLYELADADRTTGVVCLPLSNGVKPKDALSDYLGPNTAISEFDHWPHN